MHRTPPAVPQKAIREHIDEDDVLKWNITDSRIHRKAAKPENALSTHVDSDDKTTTLIQGSGYENPSRDVNRHVEIEDRYVLSSQNYQNGSFEITTRGRTIINESGLYSVILRSKMEKANHDGVSDAYPIEIQERIDKLHKFKCWVTSEILHTFTSFAPLTN